ncbi:Protein phosphatase 2C domain containing protein [Naviculisporaceae sp. PSN 640]
MEVIPIYYTRRNALARPASRSHTKAVDRRGIFERVGAASFGLGWYAYEIMTSLARTDSSPCKKPTQEAPSLNIQTGYSFDYPSPSSPKDNNDRLTQDTWSVSNPGVEGVVGYEGSCLASQGTCEDRSISGPTFVQRLSTASNGSCAILALFDPVTRKLHVACTGDSRAVLGRQRRGGKWEAVPLSVDRNGGNADEIKRIAAEHPDEDIDRILQNGRVLGLAATRTFGDAHWKWPLELQRFARKRYLSDITREHEGQVYKSPPYITAEPEVTTTILRVGKKSFMIMASDGLWDTMSSKQAVDLVLRWLEWRESGRPAKPASPPKGEKWDKFDWRKHYSSGWKVVKETITVQDENAAVHLIHNALGVLITIN